jgi:hypothetical protein
VHEAREKSIAAMIKKDVNSFCMLFDLRLHTKQKRDWIFLAGNCFESALNARRQAF